MRFGKNDVLTSIEASPYGVDSNPVKDMIAIYAETKTGSAIIGYMNVHQLAAVGEMRTYSTDADGVLKFYIWQKADGTCEIGGNTDNMVRFSKMAESVNELKNDLTTLKAAFNSWTPVPNDGGAALKTSAATWSGTSLQKDINAAKIGEIKTL